MSDLLPETEASRGGPVITQSGTTEMGFHHMPEVVDVTQPPAGPPPWPQPVPQPVPRERGAAGPPERSRAVASPADLLGLGGPSVTDLGERVAWELMRQFRGWTCWLGRCTGQWWALSPGHAPDRLLSADSPHELGRRIGETLSTSVPVAGEGSRPVPEKYERADEMLAAP